MKEEEIKNKLTPEEYHVLREKGTEAPFAGKYVSTKEKGIYKCKVCGVELFHSDTKFDSGTGWPSFYDAMPGSVEFVHDDAHGMSRVEVQCANCKSHLGHVFDDGVGTPTGKRYCLNSVCLDLQSDDTKKNIITGLLVLAVLFTPFVSQASSLKITSPEKGSSYQFGDMLPITWSPARTGVSTIQIIPTKKGEKTGLSIYGPMVFGDPVNTSGAFNYQLPDYFATPVGEYRIRLIQDSNGKIIEGPAFNLLAPGATTSTSIKKAHFTFGKISKVKSSYKPGEDISFTVQAFESKKDIATYAEGFNMQAHIFDPKNRNRGAYQAVNAQYDAEKEVWAVDLTAPTSTMKYEIELGVYCGNVGFASYCAQTYGSNNQFEKKLNFKVKK